MKTVCLIFSIGLLYLMYIFYPGVSDLTYYLWDKLKDFAMLLTITLLLIKLVEDRFWIVVFKITTAFFGCRIAVEFIVLAFPKLESPALMNYLFYGCWIAVLCIIFYKPFSKVILRKSIIRRN